MNKKTTADVLGDILLKQQKSVKYLPSDYWRNINKNHIIHVKKYGLKYFKRFINKQYFDWEVGGIVRHQLGPVISEILKGNLNPLFNSKFVDTEKKWKPFYRYQYISKLLYKIYISYLFDYISRIDRLKILQKVSEPMLGSPLLVEYRGYIISQDVCNSVHEFYSIMNKIKSPLSPQVAEIGAGYGRLAYIFLKTLPKVKYSIIDVPPALFIAQEYLKNVFPRDKIFTFRHFNSFREIQREFDESRIQFLMPHQIKHMPKNFFDIIINISSFQEMSIHQIRSYFYEVDRLTNGYFYTKQWKKSYTKTIIS